MNTQIVDLIKSQQWSDIYELLALRNPTVNLAIHDALIENCHVLEQYYFIKALSSPFTQDLYLEFAKDSIPSIHGRKRIFHNILNTLYENPNLDYPKLKYGHPLPEALVGIQPFLIALRQAYP